MNPTALIVFLLILLVLVLIHELGHFLTAKYFKIKVEEFGFGFPPRLLGKKIGETLYSFNALPIGGFVKLFGEDEAGAGKIKKIEEKKKEEKKDLDRAFFSRPIHQRAIVVVSGVVMNFLLAVLIATYFISTDGIPVDTKTVSVSSVTEDSPAGEAGFLQGDIIKSIENETITDTNTLITVTNENLGEEVSIVLLRDGKEISTTLTPRENPPEGQGAMGVTIDQNIIFEKHPFPISIAYGFRQAATDTVLVVKGFSDVIRSIVTSLTVPDGVAGPVGMAQLTGEVVRVGPSAVLALVYMLSLSLAFINILPIPGLDGGRLMFIIIEFVTRRKVNPRYEAYAHMVGIAILLGLIALISINDVGRFLSGETFLPQ